MLKICVVFAMLSGVVANAGTLAKLAPLAVVTLPEPSAIPELLACVAAAGFVAWRWRKQAGPKDPRS